MAERDGVTRRETLDALAALAGAERVAFLEMAPCDLSSSMVRRRLTAGEPIEELVGADIAAHIAKHELYGRLPASQTRAADR